MSSYKNLFFSAASEYGSELIIEPTQKPSPLTRYTLVFDEYTGENLFYEATSEMGFYTVNIDKYRIIGERYLDRISGDLREDKRNYQTAFEETLKIATPIDLYNDFLGSLIRITLAEMLNGNEVDKRIAAESVINRWKRSDDTELGGPSKNKAKTIKYVIEAAKNYEGSFKAVKEEGNYSRYKNFTDWFEWMCQNKPNVMDAIKTKRDVIDCFKIAIQNWCGSFEQIGHGVTHYISKIKGENIDGNHFERNGYSNTKYDHLIKQKRDDSIIKGYLTVLDACKKL
jgi:hypothetical protein